MDGIDGGQGRSPEQVKSAAIIMAICLALMAGLVFVALVVQWWRG